MHRNEGFENVRANSIASVMLHAQLPHPWDGIVGQGGGRRSTKGKDPEELFSLINSPFVQLPYRNGGSKGKG